MHKETMVNCLERPTIPIPVGTEFRKLYISVTAEKYRVKGDTGKLGDSEKSINLRWSKRL